jgi:hypothetical protein
LSRRECAASIDESGLSERPHRVRTWAPRGQTPVLQYHVNWKVISAAAEITWWKFYFRLLYLTTIRSPQVIDFMGHRLRPLPGQLLMLWDWPVFAKSRVEVPPPTWLFSFFTQNRRSAPSVGSRRCKSLVGVKRDCRKSTVRDLSVTVLRARVRENRRHGLE